MSSSPAAPPPHSSSPPPPPPRPGGGRASAPLVASPRASVPQAVPLDLQSGPVAGADPILLFGTEGIGKSTLASFLPAPFFLDVERSTNKLNVSRDGNIPSWAVLRGKLASLAANPPRGIQSVVLDTGTGAELLAKEFVIANRRTKEGQVSSIEDFGWGRGWQYVAEEFDGLLADCDRLIAKSIHVCVICHAVASPVPNPAGEDFIRWEPHLFAGDKARRGSIRNRLLQWAEHVLFIGYDLMVKDGKGVGSGTRTIYTYELPTHVAKSRTASVMLAYDLNDPSAIWRALGIIPNATK